MEVFDRPGVDVRDSLRQSLHRAFMSHMDLTRVVVGATQQTFGRHHPTPRAKDDGWASGPIVSKQVDSNAK